jgi:hypothetical protein
MNRIRPDSDPQHCLHIPSKYSSSRSWRLIYCFLASICWRHILAILTSSEMISVRLGLLVPQSCYPFFEAQDDPFSSFIAKYRVPVRVHSLSTFGTRKGKLFRKTFYQSFQVLLWASKRLNFLLALLFFTVFYTTLSYTYVCTRCIAIVWEKNVTDPVWWQAKEAGRIRGNVFGLNKVCSWVHFLLIQYICTLQLGRREI